jgi:uroporphyrinogen decarboxylase
VRRIIEAVQTESCVFIYHNCGNTMPLVGSILETGASAFHFGNAIDLAEMLKLVPLHIPVFGNVDPAGQFKNGTPASIREVTLQLLEKCANHDNFIVSSGCDIPPLSSWDNINAFFDAVKEFYAK